MRPSIALELHRTEILALLQQYRSSNPRVFGSVVRGSDEDGSDLDLLVDVEPGTTLFDLARRLSDEKKTVVSAPNESRDTIDPVSRPAPDAEQSVMGLQILDEIDVKGRSNDLQGIASSASQRQVSNDDFK